MIEYDDIIKDSPFLVNHLITLGKTHDFYMNKHIRSGTDILPSQYYPGAEKHVRYSRCVPV